MLTEEASFKSLQSMQDWYNAYFIISVFIILDIDIDMAMAMETHLKRLYAIIVAYLLIELSQ